MIVYAIHLARATERRMGIQRQLRECGLPYEMIDAIDGRQMSDRAWEDAVAPDALRAQRGWLSKSAVGCALSHREAYRRIVAARKGPGLVIEDDVVLARDLASVARQVAELIRDDEVVLLYFRDFGACALSSVGAVALPGGRRLMYPMSARHLHMAAAYMVGPGAARAMADSMVPLEATADAWAHYLRIGAIRTIRCVFPRPAAVRYDVQSTLGYLGEGRLQRFARFVQHARIFPLVQLTRARRANRARRASGVEVRGEPSRLVPNGDYGVRCRNGTREMGGSGENRRG